MCHFFQLLPTANEVWVKVIFSEAYVSHTVHRGGACMAGDMYGGGSVHGEGACMGVCMVGGCGRGHACRRDGH